MFSIVVTNKDGARVRSFVEIDWAEGTVTLAVGDVKYVESMARFANGDENAYATFAVIAARAAADGIAIDACGNCARFRFSGMSFDMSGGFRGYCSRFGFRAQTAVVSIDHACGEHERLATFPNDDADREARMAISRRDDARDRTGAFRGAIFGLAIGDALGFPAEFRTRAQIVATFGEPGLTDLVAVKDPRWPERPLLLMKSHPAGTYTDDTQMTIAVAEALVANGHADLDTLMRDVGARFVAWNESDDNDRAPGATCGVGCRHLAAGTMWRDAGVPDSKGCGSAMRVAPIGLYFAHDRARLLEVARASSLPTHGHDAAIEGAAAALLVALALEKRTPEEMHRALLDECAPRSPDLARALEAIPRYLHVDPAEALRDGALGEGWVAEEAVASALYCFWRTPLDFAATVLTAANTDGDSDSIACIAGGISGAFNGIDAIPESWRARIENAPYLDDLARRLWTASNEATG